MSNVFIKTSRFLYSTVRLKFPINIILSNWQVSLFKISDKRSIKYLSSCDDGLQTPMQSNFRVLMENSIKIISQLSGTS